VRQQLKALLEAVAAQQAESSASHHRSERGWAGAPSAHSPNPPPSQHRERGEGGGAATSTVKSRLEPNPDVRAKSVDNHRDNHSRHQDNHGSGRRHDRDDNCDHSWSPNQGGPQAFGRSIRDAKFLSLFRAPTNMPRYDRDTNGPTPACDSRTTGSHAMPGERQTIFVTSQMFVCANDSN
jgi:hypothetical protein